MRCSTLTAYDDALVQTGTSITMALKRQSLQSPDEGQWFWPPIQLPFINAL